MAEIIYASCALTALLCAFLLLQGYYKTKYKLLFWGGLCFVFLTANNIFLICDKLIFQEIDLMPYRMITALAAMMVMLYGLVWDEE